MPLEEEFDHIISSLYTCTECFLAIKCFHSSVLFQFSGTIDQWSQQRSQDLSQL